jgi:RND family efflux transporter MFP subunit
LAAGLALVLAATAALWVAASTGAGDEVPTFRVERGPFVLRVPAEGVLKAVSATPISAPPDAPGPMRIAWLAQDGAAVEEGEVVMRFDPSELEKEELDASGQVDQADLKLERHETETDSRLRNLGRDAEAATLELEMSRQFERTDEEIFSRFDIIESGLDGELAAQRKKHADSSMRSEEQLASAQADLYELDKSKAMRSFERARAGLAAIEVRAPHAGVLVIQRNWKGDPVRVGDTVWGRQTLMEIPELSAMEAEVFVLEADAGGLAAGDPAQVVVEAFPGRVYDAVVERIASFAQPRLRGSPVQYFSVTLKLAATDRAVMRPGQRVRADLLAQEIASAAVVPRQALFERDGQQVVLRRTPGGSFEPVPVEIAASGPGRVAISDGLADGDVLALADPEAPRRAPQEVPGETNGPAEGPALPGGGR